MCLCVRVRAYSCVYGKLDPWLNPSTPLSVAIPGRAERD